MDGVAISKLGGRQGKEQCKLKAEYFSAAVDETGMITENIEAQNKLFSTVFEYGEQNKLFLDGDVQATSAHFDDRRHYAFCDSKNTGRGRHKRFVEAPAKVRPHYKNLGTGVNYSLHYNPFDKEFK